MDGLVLAKLEMLYRYSKRIKIYLYLLKYLVFIKISHLKARTLILENSSNKLIEILCISFKISIISDKSQKFHIRLKRLFSDNILRVINKPKYYFIKSFLLKANYLLLFYPISWIPPLLQRNSRLTLRR
jgi:hypothetical protein